MEELLARCAHLPKVTLDAGDVLVSEGSTTGALQVLESGRVAVRKGDTPIAVIERRGACFGEMAALLDMPHTATVEALEPTTVRIARDARGFLSDDPTAALLVARILAGRLQLVTSYLADLREQYGEHEGGLGMVDTVLSRLSGHVGQTFEPGSARDPDPLY